MCGRVLTRVECNSSWVVRFSWNFVFKQNREEDQAAHAESDGQPHSLDSLDLKVSDLLARLQIIDCCCKDSTVARCFMH